MEYFEERTDKTTPLVPIAPTSKNETTALAEALRNEALSYAQDMQLWIVGNKTAGTRARTTMAIIKKMTSTLNKAMIKTDKGEW